MMQTKTVDHSNKSILARGCDPNLSKYAQKMIPPLVGNPTYVPTTNDLDFIEKLKTEKWSVIYFAPGACRFSAMKHQIPGGISHTKGWTLKEYKELVLEYQGDDIQIVESVNEEDTIELLSEALEHSEPTQ